METFLKSYKAYPHFDTFEATLPYNQEIIFIYLCLKLHILIQIPNS